MNHPIIIFDGVCNFCNAAVNFIIKRDKNRIFRFAAFQSATGQRLLGKYDLSYSFYDSFILIDQGNIYIKSRAAIRVLKSLPFFWKLILLLILVPAPLRDYIYDIMAKNRYKWFGKRTDCIIPSSDVRDLFLE